MSWTVIFYDEFDDEFDDEFSQLADDLQDELLAHARVLAQFGPHLGRPTVDTLNASGHTNMKELRFDWQGGVWRAWLSLSTLIGKPFFWWVATRWGRISDASQAVDSDR